MGARTEEAELLGKEGGSACVNFKQPVMAAVAAAASSDHSTDAFVPAHSHSFTLLLLLSSCPVSLVIQCERSGGYQSHRCLFQTSKPGAPVHPSAPIIISARPRRKASYAGGEIFDLSSLRGSTVTQTTGAPRRMGGGGEGGEAAAGAGRETPALGSKDPVYYTVSK